MIHLDLETRSAVDLKKSGAEVYARHPSTQILCVAFAINDKPVKVWPAPGTKSPGQCSQADVQELFERIQQGEAVVAHNYAFEKNVWNEIGHKRFGWPLLKVEQMDCTMALSYAQALPGSLDGLAQALGLSITKDKEGHRIMQRLSKPKKIVAGGCVGCWGESEGCAECYRTGDLYVWHEPNDPTNKEKFEKLYRYCANDVEVERQAHARLLALSQAEREVFELDAKINARGLRIDRAAIKVAQAIVEMEKKRFDCELSSLTKGKVKSAKEVSKLLAWLKLKQVETEGLAKQKVSDLLAKSDLPKDVRRVLEIRRDAALSATAKLTAMLNGSCADGRMRGLFQYHGAQATGRFAGRRAQPHNFPRNKIPQEQIEEVFSLLRGVTEGEEECVDERTVGQISWVPGVLISDCQVVRPLEEL